MLESLPFNAVHKKKHCLGLNAVHKKNTVLGLQKMKTFVSLSDWTYMK